MIELSLNQIKKYYGATKVLENITFDVKSGEKVGLVGRNGSGKTTILKIIHGIETQDEGILSIKKGATLGYLDQIPVFPKEYTVIDVLQSAFRDILKISSDMKALEVTMATLTEDALMKAVQRYGELELSFEHMGGYELEENMSKICIGLKITDRLKYQLFDKLSGGEKTIVILGRILLQKADILLLDEPSNHLDLESIEWLEDYLRSFKGIALIVSHDRYFLDKVVTKIIEFEDMETTTYDGNYSAYVKQKEQDLFLQFEAFKDQQKKIKAMEKTIKDLRDWGLRADNNKFFRRAVSMEKKLEKMVRIDKPKTENDSMRINFLNTDRSGKEAIIIKNLTKGFGDNLLIQNSDLLVRFGERTAFIGKNGSGKSTLIKLLLGELVPDAGSAMLGANVKVGYLPQHITFNNEDNTVLETFRENVVLPEGKAREYLSKYMFYGESVFKRVKGLSGGEKSRLKLAMLMYEEINLLILDEPTNHLDIDSIETLEETLKTFIGTIFFISHDRYFINSLGSRIVELCDKNLIGYSGDYDYYREEKSKLKSKETQTSQVKRAKSLNIPKNNSTKRIETKGSQELEALIEQLEKELKEIDHQMLSFSTDPNKLVELDKQKQSLNGRLDTLINEWLERA